MAKLTIMISDKIHEKPRWLAYKERSSQQAILLHVVEKALSKEKVPKEDQK